MGLDSWFGITNNSEYSPLFFDGTFIVSIVAGVISTLRMSYEIVSRGWI